MSPRGILAAIGRPAKARVGFVLQTIAMAWGVLREGAHPSTWRRSVRRRCRISLTRSVAGSLGTVVVTGLIVGVGLVFETIYWLRNLGQEAQIGRVLVAVLIRELTPLLIGIILLGRGGMAAISELGELATEGEVAVLRAEGIDIFQNLVLPRAVAFAFGGFALGTMFVVTALVSGFVTGSLTGSVHTSVLVFLDDVLRAATVSDLIVFPAKLLLIGLLIAVVCCATGLGADEADTGADLLPRGFTRGITAVLAITLVLSVLL